MLTEDAYHLGITIYLLSALLGLVLFQHWLLRRWRVAVRLLLLLPLAGLLLTPAYTRPGGDTMAPALIVSAFHLLTDGVGSAAYALRPLLLFTLVSLGLGLLLYVGLSLLRQGDS